MRRHEVFLHPLVRQLARWDVAPDTLTLWAIPPAIAAGIAAGSGAFILAAALIMASGLFDLLDGALARHSRRESRFGALLDSTLDRACDASVPLGLVVFYAPAGGIAAVPATAMLTGFLISYVRARAQSLGLELPRLWMRRQDRFGLTVASLLLAPVAFPGLPVAAPAVLATQALLAVLGTLATISALRAAYRASVG